MDASYRTLAYIDGHYPDPSHTMVTPFDAFYIPSLFYIRVLS